MLYYVYVMEPRPIHTVVLYPRPHPDNIIGLWLLREFGKEAFPGIHEAKIAFWNKMPPEKSADDWEMEGYLLIDMGGGKFDHHHDVHIQNKRECASTLIAAYLGIEQRPELKKLLEYVRRDDLEGKGTISKDVIDRAFGLSAIVMNLNRDYPEHPEFVIDTVTRIVVAHYHEEYRRKVLMPKEWEQLKADGKAKQIGIPTAAGVVNVVSIETDSKSMVGYLRAVKDIQADIVVQRQTSGNTNIVTRQTTPRLNLKPVISALRIAEAKKKNLSLSGISASELEKPTRLEGIDEWYFDTAANTLQNGGVAAEGVAPTQLTIAEVVAILEQTIPQAIPPRTQVHEDEGPVFHLGDLRPRPQAPHHRRPRMT